MLRVAEIFQSVQGEGLFAGTASVFLRTTGCNLRCWFCDTPYTSWQPEGVRRSWNEVLSEILAFGCEHIVITGGEPLLQPDIVPLSQALKAANKVITVETAGTIFRPVSADLMSVSPKLANSNPVQPAAIAVASEWNGLVGLERPFPMPDTTRSIRWAKRHEDRRVNREALRQLLTQYRSQLKFVIDHPGDLDDVEEFLNQSPELARDLVWVMPQARTIEEIQEKSKWLIPRAKELGFQYSSRLHIELFGNIRGT